MNPLAPEHSPGSRLGRPAQSLPTTRLEAFSDGVFAIAITLLILDLKVPASPDRLLDGLVDEWPSFLGYLVSFAFIGGLWIAHTGLTRQLKATDGVFLGLNLMLLLFVSFLPFTTSLFTTHLIDSGQRVAVVAFGLNLTLAALMGGVQVSYVARTAELTWDADRAGVLTRERGRWGGVLLLTLSTTISALFPPAAVLFYLSVSLVLIARPIWGMHVQGRNRRGR